jgi:hypothetical protein
LGIRSDVIAASFDRVADLNGRSSSEAHIVNDFEDVPGIRPKTDLEVMMISSVRENSIDSA